MCRHSPPQVKLESVRLRSRVWCDGLLIGTKGCLTNPRVSDEGRPIYTHSSLWSSRVVPDPFDSKSERAYKEDIFDFIPVTVKRLRSPKDREVSVFYK